MQPKKLLTIFLAVILTCFLAVSISAEDDPLTMAVEVSSSTAIPNQSDVCIKAGDEIKVKITVGSAPEIGIAAYELSLNYNPKAFEYKSYSLGDAAVKTPIVGGDTANGNKGVIDIGIVDSEVTLKDGTLITVTFVAKDYHDEDSGKQAFELDCKASDFGKTDWTFLSSINVTNGSVELHNFDEGSVVIGNCVEKGTVTYSCTKCDKKCVDEGTIAPDNHKTPEKLTAVPATCTETGLTEGLKCTACDVTITAQEVVPVLGHTFTAKRTEAKYQLTTQSCTDPAEFYFSCVACGESCKDHLAELGEDFVATFVDKEALGHTFDGYLLDLKYKKADATCTVAETFYVSCSVCKISSKGTPQETTFTNGKPDGHKFDKKVVTTATLHTAATCTTDAIYYANCSVCDISSKGIDDTALFTATNSALGHKFDATKAEPKYLKTAATCAAKAVYFKSCSVCGEVGTDTFESGELLAHKFDKKVVATATLHTAASCTKDAIYYANCSVCDISSRGLDDTALFTATNTATGHKYDATKAEDKYLKTAATCTAKAVYFKSCSVCGEKGTDTFEAGELLAHKFDASKAEATYLKTAATCTAKAVYFKSCSACGAKGTETFESGELLAHKFDKEAATDAYKATDATCTDKATYYKSCSACGAKGTETFENGVLADHAAEDLVKLDAVAPTCTETGLTEGEMCSKCNTTTKAQESVAAKGHVAGDWVVETEPKIGKEGKQYKSCTVCSSVVETEAIPAKSALPIILIIVAVVVVGGGVGAFFVLKNKKEEE